MVKDIFGNKITHDIFGHKLKREKKSKTTNIFGDDLSFGLTRTQKKEVERDTRRVFSQTQKNEIRYRQNEKCAVCHKQLESTDIEYDHKKPWADTGRTTKDNGRALCGSCHNKVTHDTTLKKVDKKRKTPTKKENNSFLGDGNIFG